MTAAIARSGICALVAILITACAPRPEPPATSQGAAPGAHAPSAAPPPRTATFGDTTRHPCYVVGAWNLEHFGSGSRGFPENTRGGRTYPPRTPEQIESLAVAIRDGLGAKILMLSEINPQRTSPGLSALLEALGPTWASIVSRSGGRQRTAVIFDQVHARLLASAEIEVPELRLDGKDIFERDPLVARFVLLDGDVPANDLVVIALHLASGQANTANHDEALRRLLEELGQLRGTEVLPDNEWDILLGGDLNLSLFDDDEEAAVDELREDGYEFLLLEPHPSDRRALLRAKLNTSSEPALG